NKRKLFRVKFPQLLETDLTVLEIKGKRVNVGNTKVLVRDMGPGGLCYISNIKLPPEKDLILQFVGHLLGTEIKVRGYTVWAEEIDHNLHKYGVQFTIDDDEKAELFRILNQVQIKMRKNILFAEGSFVSVVPAAYFKIIKEDERGGG
ncbi:MAG: PilZ domain-containing protein, partial [Bacillota bacterium]